MSASYPSSVRSFTTKLDGPGNTIFAAYVNDPQDEIAAIEDGLLNGVGHALKPSVGGAQDLGTAGLPWGNVRVSGLQLASATTITLATDAATVTKSSHAIDTEGAAGTDNCATLTAGAGVADGFIVIVRAANVAHIVTMKDGTGNLLLNGDYTMSATDATMMLQYDGTNWRELARSISGGSVLDRKVTLTTVVSTTTETDLYSYSVVGGTLGTTRALRLMLWGDYLQNVSGADTLTIKVKYGATTVLTCVITAAQSTERRSLFLLALVSAQGATNVQVAYGNCKVGNVGPTNTGTMSLINTLNHEGDNISVAEDSTAAKTFAVTAQHSSNSASASVKSYVAILELL